MSSEGHVESGGGGLVAPDGAAFAPTALRLARLARRSAREGPAGGSSQALEQGLGSVLDHSLDERIDRALDGLEGPAAGALLTSTDIAAERLGPGNGARGGVRLFAVGMISISGEAPPAQLPEGVQHALIASLGGSRITRPGGSVAICRGLLRERDIDAPARRRRAWMRALARGERIAVGGPARGPRAGGEGVVRTHLRFLLGAVEAPEGEPCEWDPAEMGLWAQHAAELVAPILGRQYLRVLAPAPLTPGLRSAHVARQGARLELSMHVAREPGERPARVYVTPAARLSDARGARAWHGALEVDVLSGSGRVIDSARWRYPRWIPGAREATLERIESTVSGAHNALAEMIIEGSLGQARTARRGAEARRPEGREEGSVVPFLH